MSKEPRRWRGLDLGMTEVYLQATTRRVACPTHGVVVAAVPWARPGSRFTDVNVGSLRTPSVPLAGPAPSDS
ncbi:MAG: transposase family protein [Pseudonocardiaceae bacterium]